MEYSKKLLKLARMVMTFNEVRTDKDLLIYEGDKLEIGTEVLVEKEGDFVAPENGEYKAEDGIIYVIEDGKVTDIKEPVAEEEKAPVETEMVDMIPDIDVDIKPESEVKIDELEDKLEEAYKEIARLNEVIKELENKNLQPVEEPIDQSPKVDDNMYSKQGALKYFQ